MTLSTRCNKIFCFVLICSLFVVGFLPLLTTEASAASVSDFTDVSSNSWYYNSVGFCVQRGLFYGTSNSSFSPGGNMTRAMFVTVLGRYASAAQTVASTNCGCNIRSGPSTSYDKLGSCNQGTAVTVLGVSGEWYQVKVNNVTGYIRGDLLSFTYPFHSFSDVDYSAYYASYALWSFDAGVVNGYGAEDVFSPDTDITREQICAMLQRYLSHAGITLSRTGSTALFGDDDHISDWARDAVYEMRACGIVNGSDDGNFYPQNAATRAEVATIFCNLCRALGENTDFEPETDPETTDASTPAPLLDVNYTIKYDTVKVAIYYGSTAVSKTWLNNPTGGYFEYGTLDASRHFVSQGTLEASTLELSVSDGGVKIVNYSSGDEIFTSSGEIVIQPIDSEKIKIWNSSKGTYWTYYGAFSFRPDSAKLTAINVVGLEEYVKGVVPFESSPGWPLEALKAQAVAARNYVIANFNKYASKGYDLTPGTADQCYQGRQTCSDQYFANSDKAVEETEGQVLTYLSGSKRCLCTCYFSSSDGGATEDSGHIWYTTYSYLIGKVDPYEGAAASEISYYVNTHTFARTSDQMNKLASALGLSTIAPNGITVNTYPVTGNVKSVVVTDVNGKSASFTGDSRWTFLGYFDFSMYSYRYMVVYDSDTDSFSLTRRGWGHNVGMSQWGAYAMAKYYNKTYREILGFYYDSTELVHGVTI